MNLDGMFSKDVEGHAVTRPARCLCGAAYTQSLLSSRFLEMAERAGAMPATLKMLPDLYVPLNCPPCESRELGRLANARHYATQLYPLRSRLEDQPRFARVMAQMCGVYNRPTDSETVAVYWRALSHSMTDDEFEGACLAAIRSQRKWPTVYEIGEHAKLARRPVGGDRSA